MANGDAKRGNGLSTFIGGDVYEGAALEKEIEGRDVTQRGGAMIVADREGVAFAGE